MPDDGLLYGVLGLICACLMILTATALVLVRDLRRALGQLTLLVKRSNQVMVGARRVLAKAEVATGRVTRVVSSACTVAENALGSLHGLTARVGAMASKLLGNGNGAGSEPRSRYHR